MMKNLWIAAIAVGGGTALREMLHPVLAWEAPLLVFLGSVVAAAHYGGYAAALLTTGVAATVGAFFFMPPRFVLAIPDATEGLRLVIFLGEGVIIAMVFDRLRRLEQPP